MTIVTTTINEPTEALVGYLEIAKDKGYKMVIVGDKKTPHKMYQRAEKEYECLTYLTPEDQEEMDQELSDLIGWNCIQRRNFGFIWALQNTDSEWIAIKLGYRTSVRKKNQVTTVGNEVYEIIASKLRNYVKLYHSPEKVKYSGKVYCVTVSSGIIMVRRNGNPAFCGNCIHNLFATGTPIVTMKAHYDGKLAGTLLNNETCLDITSNTPEQVAQLIKNNEDRNEQISKAMYNKFSSEVDFDEDARKIQNFLENLI